MFSITDRGFADSLHLDRWSGRAAGTAPVNAGRAIYRFGRCQVRPACREVLVDAAERRLQPRPFDVLVYLIEQRHRVVPIDELLDVVWGGREVQIGSLASSIARIRSVLADGEPGNGTIIQTHHRVGYRFVAALEGDSTAAPGRLIAAAASPSAGENRRALLPLPPQTLEAAGVASAR